MSDKINCIVVDDEPLARKGIENFATAEQLAQELEAIGFTEVSFERLSLGIVAIHIARKPGVGLRVEGGTNR